MFLHLVMFILQKLRNCDFVSMIIAFFSVVLEKHGKYLLLRLIEKCVLHSWSFNFQYAKLFRPNTSVK